MSRPLGLAFVVALALCASCSRQESKAPAAGTPAQPRLDAWPLTLQPAELMIAANSAEPQLTQHDRGAVLSWLEHGPRGATLKFSELTATGWSAPATVASGKDWFVSWADVPSVARLENGSLVGQWLKNVDPTIEAYDLILSTSHDNGRTWTTPFTPHHDRTRTQHGFASLFRWPDGGGQPGYGVVWLDGRDQELNTKDREGGAMALYAARFDHTGKQVSEAAVNDRVCECCSTSVAMTTDGPVAAFRDRSDKEVRDIHVSRFENGAWSAATLVHADNWTIDSCPVNGPGIAARDKTVAVSWFALQNGKGHSYLAFSTDGGRTFGGAMQLDDTTSQGHVGVQMLEDGSAAATWIEFDNQRSRLRARRVDTAGHRSEAIDIAGTGAARVSGHPRIARVGSDVVFAWTESAAEGDSESDASQQVKVATATLPSR